jgi:hypothetical protein
MAFEMVCQSCGHFGGFGLKVKGSLSIEVRLWVCLLVPGIIYSIWRRTTKERVCAICGSPNMLQVELPRTRAA